jgi:leader peptidase (prepilin peptidase) / N-methyltransferase
MSPLIALAAAGLAVAAGPALRVEAFRRSVSAGRPPRATCPRCDRAVVQRGQSWRYVGKFRWGECSSCGLRLGPPSAAVEVAAATLFAGLALAADEALTLVAYCFVAAVGLTLAIVDVAVHRLPDELTALLAAGVVAVLMAQALVASAGRQLLEAMAAGLGAALFYLLMSLLTAGGIGLGDAKLAFGLGVAVGWNGWSAVFVATTLSLLLTGVAAVALLVLNRAGRKDSIPHGPFMVVAAVATLLLTSL